MYKCRPVGVLVLAVLVVLATGMMGVTVAADSPASATLSDLEDGEITVDEPTDDDETEPDENETEDSFEVSDLDAPETVAVGETVTVTATISNPNDFETNQSVEFRVDGDVVDRQTLAIEGEQNRTVGISLDSEALGVDSYIHGFLTTDRGELAILDVIPFAEIAFDDQETDGESVVVDSVTLSEGGFIGIYDEDDELVGVSEYLDAGDHEEIEIELPDGLDDDADLTAGVYLDADGDETFEFDDDDSLDQPYVDVDGEPITDSATVTVPTEEDESDAEDDVEEDESDVEDDVEEDESDAEDDVEEDESDAEDDVEEDESDAEDDVEEDESDAEDDVEEGDANDTDSVETVEPAVNFSDQESDAESVVVDTAVLPVDGYVAIYEDDEIIGVSDYLEEGDHEAIEIDLFDVRSGSFDRDRLAEDTTLIAVLHEENSDNEKFDHVRNEIRDGPIVDDEDSPIFDVAEITVPEPESESEDDSDAADRSDNSNAADRSNNSNAADRSDNSNAADRSNNSNAADRSNNSNAADDE